MPLTSSNLRFPRRGISIVCLLYNTEFLNNSLAFVLNPNEIHSLGQTRHINLLGFIGDVARKQRLACHVGDDVFRW